MYHRKASKAILNRVLGFGPAKMHKKGSKSECCGKINRKNKYCKSCPVRK